MIDRVVLDWEKIFLAWE